MFAVLSSVSPDLPLDVSPQESPQSPEVYRMSRFPIITSHVCQYQVARPRFPRLVSSHSVILCPWLCPDNVSLLLLKSPSECLQSRYLMLLSVVHCQVSLARKVSLPLSPPSVSYAQSYPWCPPQALTSSLCPSAVLSP